MSLISLDFFIFFFLVCLVYFVLPQSFQWVWLLISSLTFYFLLSTTSITGFVFFIFMVLINWIGAFYMKEDNPRRSLLYTAVLIFDIASLAVFKYSDFFHEIYLAIGRMFGADLSGGAFEAFVEYTTVNCPQKISYFAIILIMYITDVYWEKSKAISNPGKALLFASFFPIMTSGPIITFEQMNSQLWGSKHTFSYDRCVRGMERVLWGLFKKMVLSERMAVIVTRIYDYYEIYGGLYIFVAAGMFSMQLYCDFSGLMDIVLGISEVLGITLPENFSTPFYSMSITEFWRRWHITLGAFLRDYVLYPIQRGKIYRKLNKWCKAHMGKRYEKKFNLPLYLSLLVTWLLIGLWHGGGWNFIFGVGIYMWLIIVLENVMAPVFEKLTEILHINTECASYRLFKMVRTFILFSFGNSFFRAKSLQDGFAMWKLAFSKFNPWIFFDESFFNIGLDRREWGILAFGLILLFIVSFISQKEDVRDVIKRQNFVARLAIFSFIFVMIIVYGYYGSQFNAADFIYGRF